MSFNEKSTATMLAVLVLVYGWYFSVVLVRLALGRDRILARVTRRSVRELNLQVGDEVFAQIKSVAVRSPYSLKSTSSSATT